MRQSSRRTRRRFAQVGSGTSICLRYRMPQAVARLPDAPALSRNATHRLKILEYARTHSVAATCRHFGIARSTYYRWAQRYDSRHLSFLENRSSRPKQCRHPTWTPAQAAAVLRAREAHPRWGKDKLAVVLRRDGITLSVSMIGRILSDLKRRGVLIEPRPTRLRPHARHARPYAIRKPPEHLVAAARRSRPARHHAPNSVAGGGAASLQRGGPHLPLERGRGALLRHGRDRVRFPG